MHRSNSRNQKDVFNQQEAFQQAHNQNTSPYNFSQTQIASTHQRGNGASSTSQSRFNQTSSNPTSNQSSSSHLHRQMFGVLGAGVNSNSALLSGVTGGFITSSGQNSKHPSNANSRQDLYRTSTQQRDEMRELMGQLEQPDDDLTISSLSQSPWNGAKSRQRMQQTNGTYENSNSHDNEGTLGRSEILEGTYEENKSLQITRRQNQTSYIEDLDEELSQSKLGEDEDDESELYQSRQEKFKRRVATEDPEKRKGNSPDFHRGAEEELDISNNELEDLAQTHNAQTATYREKPMGDNPLSRRNQNRTFADSVITGLNQLTSSSNNNTYRNNYSSNQETNRHSARTKQRASAVSGGVQRARREDLRSDIDEESEEDINRGIQEQSDDEEDDDEEYARSRINHRDHTQDEEEEDKEEVSPYPNRRTERGRSNNNRVNNREDHNLDSSEFSNVDSFTQTQYSKISRIGKSKLFGRVKGEDLDLTEDEYNASVLKKSPIGQRFRNLADNESLSLTPASGEGKWQNQKSAANSRAINRTTLDNKSQLNAKFNLQTANCQNINTLNLTEGTYDVAQTLFGGHSGSSGPGSGGPQKQANPKQPQAHQMTSISRDQELEQALEEDSNLVHKTTLTNSGGDSGYGKAQVFNGSSEVPLRQQNRNKPRAEEDRREENNDEKVKYHNVQLQVKVNQQNQTIKELAEQLESSDFQKNQLLDQVRELDLKLVDTQEHVQLLKQKLDGDASLQQLRGRHLDQAKLEIKNLSRNLEIKSQQVSKLEKHLRTQEKQEAIALHAQEDMIRDQHRELEKLRVLCEASKREARSSKQEANKHQQDQQQLRQDFQVQQQRLREEYDQYVRQLQAEFEGKLQVNEKAQQDLAKKLKQMERMAKQGEQKSQEERAVTESKQQIIEELELEKQKIAIELGNYRERCKDLEIENEHIRGGQVIDSQANNQSYAGKANSTFTGLNQSRANNYDFEVKKMKDMYTQQLSKAKEEASKYRSQARDLETRLKTLEEEASKKYKQSITQTTEQIEKDQLRILETQKLSQRLAKYAQDDQEIRYLFGIESNERDLIQSLLKVKEDLEVKELLEQEHQKLQTLLQEAQQREKELIDLQWKQQQSQGKASNVTSAAGMSSFAQTLILSKEREIDDLKQKCEKERKGKLEIQDQVWRLQNDLKSLELSNQELDVANQEIQRELLKVRESKDKADNNVDELKEKLRTALRDQSELQQALEQLKTQQPKREQAFLDDVERKKYEELVNLILELDLARDPLQDVASLSLQESFIDEFEQACKHLKEQSRLVREIVERLSSEAEARRKEVKDLQLEVKNHLGAVESRKREMFRLQDIVRDKERDLEINQAEQGELHKTCERLSALVREGEEQNARLRAENEEVKTNIRKLMRAQDSLHKVSSLQGSSLQKSQVQERPEKTELERMQMSHEDQIAKIVALQDQQYQQDILVVREQIKSEFLETFDKVISASLKDSLNLNDLGTQIVKRVERVRQQEKAKLESAMAQYKVLEQTQQSNALNKAQDSIQQQLAHSQFSSSSVQNNQKPNERYHSISAIISQEEQNAVKGGDELAESIHKWVRESGINSQNIKQRDLNSFKNFFSGDDQNSLMLSELISYPNQALNAQQLEKEQQLNSIISQLQNDLEDLQSVIRDKDRIIEELQEKVFQLQSFKSSSHQSQASDNDKLQLQILRLQDDLRTKDRALENLEETHQEKLSKLRKEIETESRLKQESLFKEVEALKEQMRKQLQAKSEQLESEYEELERQRTQLSDSVRLQKREQESLFQQRLDQQEQLLKDRLRAMEMDIKNGCEMSKEQQITALCKQLEEQHSIRLKTQAEEMQSQIALLKSEHASKLEEAKKTRERESKKARDDSDRLRKHTDERVKKLEQERSTEKECWERESKEKLEQLVAKHKKEVKAAQDKVRAEMRNQVDSVKNELAKAKAEFEREKKKLISDHQSALEELKRESEEQLERELKQLREKQEKLAKKRVDEKQQELTQEMQRKVEQLECEVKELKELHQSELRRERERLEGRIKEQLRGEVKMELHEEMEAEFREQLDRIKQQQLVELDKLKTRYEMMLREERASLMPAAASLQQENNIYRSTGDNRSVEMSEMEVQCELITSTTEDRRLEGNFGSHQVNGRYQQASYINTSQVQNSQPNAVIRSSEFPRQQNSSEKEVSSFYVEQLKSNFEEELERQQQLFEQQLVGKQNAAVKVFEELMVLEFDKILHSIYFKSNQSATQQKSQGKKARNEKQSKISSQQDLERRRNEINKLIADILNRNDDRQERQMRRSLESLKRKISEVLKVFKTELETKLSSKFHQLHEQQLAQRLDEEGEELNREQMKERLRLPLPVGLGQQHTQSLSDLISLQADESARSLEKGQFYHAQNMQRVIRRSQEEIELQEHRLKRKQGDNHHQRQNSRARYQQQQHYESQAQNLELLSADEISEIQESLETPNSKYYNYGGQREFINQNNQGLDFEGEEEEPQFYQQSEAKQRIPKSKASQQQNSKTNTQFPTPRNLDEEQKAQLGNKSSSKQNQQNALSDVKKYAQVDDEQNQDILRRVAPVVNSKGVLTVEVEKVVRDLRMLLQSLLASKFSKLLLSSLEDSQLLSLGTSDSQQSSSDATLQQYRLLLNDSFKLISKLNAGVDAISKQSELYKLKLLNSELKEKLQKYQSEADRNSAAVQVEETLLKFQRVASSMGEASQKCLGVLENAQLSINKLLFKVYQLLELFKPNSGLDEIDSRCLSYLQSNPNDQAQIEQLLESTYSPNKLQATQKICPELLSPEETAQLVADVFQRLNHTYANTKEHLGNTQNLHIPGVAHQLDSYQSFFNTFLSNDEYVRSAENFIQKYREQKLNHTQTQQLRRTNANLPLQRRENQQFGQQQTAQHRQYQSVQLSNLENKKRSRSQSNHGGLQTHNQSVLTQQPQYLNNHFAPLQLNQTASQMSNPSQTHQVSNVFQQRGSTQTYNHLDNMHSISIHTQNPSLVPSANAAADYQSHNENFNRMNFHSQSNNNQSTFTRAAEGNQKMRGYGARKNSLGQGSGSRPVGSVSSSYNGNPWKQNTQSTQQQNQTNYPQGTQRINQSYQFKSTGFSEPIILTNQTQNIYGQKMGDPLLQMHMSPNGSIQRGVMQHPGNNLTIQSDLTGYDYGQSGEGLTNQVNQTQSSVNAMFEKLRSNYLGDLNATKHQNYN